MSPTLLELPISNDLQAFDKLKPPKGTCYLRLRISSFEPRFELYRYNFIAASSEPFYA